MSTKVAIGLFVIAVLMLIPIAVNGIMSGDTRSFVLALLVIVIAFLGVNWVARYNRKMKDKNQHNKLS